MRSERLDRKYLLEVLNHWPSICKAWSYPLCYKDMKGVADNIVVKLIGFYFWSKIVNFQKYLYFYILVYDCSITPNVGKIHLKDLLTWNVIVHLWGFRWAMKDIWQTMSLIVLNHWPLVCKAWSQHLCHRSLVHVVDNKVLNLMGSEANTSDPKCSTVLNWTKHLQLLLLFDKE